MKRMSVVGKGEGKTYPNPKKRRRKPLDNSWLMHHFDIKNFLLLGRRASVTRPVRQKSTSRRPERI